MIFQEEFFSALKMIYIEMLTKYGFLGHSNSLTQDNAGWRF